MASFLLQAALAAVVYASLASGAPASVCMQIKADPVEVSLYYESLCPGCHGFIMTQLIPTWQKVNTTNLMTVKLLPFGNAHETPDGDKWVFQCQHGPAECDGNLVESCILNYYPETNQQLQIIKCVEENFYNSQGSDWRQTLKNCTSTGVDVEKISTCVTGDEGNQLQHAVAEATGDHEWVPWVMLDGVANEDAGDDLLKEVCKAYKGDKPSVCNQIRA